MQQPRLVQGIFYHHSPALGFDIVCDLTCAANQIAKGIEAGLDGRDFHPTIPPEVTERLGLTPDTLELLSPAAGARYAQVSRRYNAV